MAHLLFVRVFHVRVNLFVVEVASDAVLSPLGLLLSDHVIRAHIAGRIRKTAHWEGCQSG